MGRRMVEVVNVGEAPVVVRARRRPSNDQPVMEFITIPPGGRDHFLSVAINASVEIVSRDGLHMEVRPAE